MPRKTSRGIRSPLSEEARRNIAQAVKAAAEKKRLAVEAEVREIKKERRVRVENKKDMNMHMDKEMNMDKDKDKVGNGNGNGNGEGGKRIAIDIVRMDEQNFSPTLFEPMQTGKDIDGFFSSANGIPRATNYMIIGDPGVGKSTVGMDILSDLNNKGYKVLFIMAEMTRIDLFGYVKRYPKFGNLPILFLTEYLDSNPKLVLEEAISEGYDVILIDSFAEVCESLREANSLSINQAEKWLIDTMIRNNLGENRGGFNTTFLCIQQVTKGGGFVGTNKLKHNTTGMLELRFDEGGKNSYMSFTKNRRGVVGVRMSFNLAVTGDVKYERGVEEVGVSVGVGKKPRKSGGVSGGDVDGDDEYSVFLNDMPEF